MVRGSWTLVRGIVVAATFVVFSAAGFAASWHGTAADPAAHDARVRGQAPVQPQGQAQGQAPAPAVTHVFGADAGLVINGIKADKTADFEMVMNKVKEALQVSQDPKRRAQGANWRVFRAVESGPNNTVLYVFWIDPPMKGADYTIGNILAESFPGQVQALYKTFNDCFEGGQSILNLRLVSTMGQ